MINIHHTDLLKVGFIFIKILTNQTRERVISIYMTI
jgi:hypothetical protein